MTSVSSSSSSVICKEVFDDGCLPSAEEINEYALKIGINPNKEPYLLYLAKEGLMQALPADWKVCYNDKLHAVYYYNEKTKASQWDHPLDNVYRDLVDKARSERQKQQQQNQQNQQKISTFINTSSVTTAIDNNSDDVSQLDSGIRSLQGNEDLDSNHTQTNNDTTTMHSSSTSSSSSSLKNSSVAMQNSKMNPLASRFLDMRGRKQSGLEPIKNSRFEVVKTNPQIGLAMRFNNNNNNDSLMTTTNPIINGRDEIDSDGGGKGFTISGTGAMFLKSNIKKHNNEDADANFTKSNNTDDKVKGLFIESLGHSVKGILRDSSLTDVRRRMDNEEGGGTEDKKSVRFNLDDIKMRSANSPEDDPSSSRRFGPSPEISDNSVEDDDDDPWDFVEEDDPIDQKHVKEVKVVPAAASSSSSSSTLITKPIMPIQFKGLKPVLKSQISSDEVLNKAQNKPQSSLIRTFSVDSNTADTNTNTTTSKSTNSSILEKMKEPNLVKPLYESDSESRASSIRSFVQKLEENSNLSEVENINRIQMEDLNRQHKQQIHELKMQLEIERNAEEEKLRSEMKESLNLKKQELIIKNKKELEILESNRNAGLLSSNISNETVTEEKRKTDNLFIHDIEKYRREKELEKNQKLKIEDEKFKKLLETDLEELKHNHNHQLQQVREEYEMKFESHKKQLETDFQKKINECRTELEREFDMKRRKIVEEHKATMNTLQQNHAEILQELERDLKSEEEIVKKEHAKRLTEMKDKLSHELELERQRMRESGEDRLYEKIRCEKRLLEDKYRCLKEKYIRLKTDVKLSLERRNRRREQQATQQQSLTTTTGSETEKSTSNKPSIGNSENKSASVSTPYSAEQQPKPPITPRNPVNVKEHIRDKSAERHHSRERKMGIASKYIKQLQAQYQDDTTSISQSDTTISNNYPKGKYLPGSFGDNGNSDSEAFRCNQENNNNPRDRQRKKLFSRMKSASTSRLNAENFKVDRPCTPVENLRRQLQKLEDLEDQFPDNTLDTTYHLRYPFSDISNDHAGTSSELEFFKHRIHLERDSVRRAKESLRTQRTNFRARQREIKQRHKVTSTRHTLDQLIQEERELTEMEVNLHRTRALLGEKVIRLRHLEQSLQRIYEKEKPMDFLQIENKDDATLSDLSSHSSSGFSSTDFASDTNQANINRRKEMYQESSECIQNLEILNAEIREILDILSKQQNHDRLETYRQLAAGRMQTSVIDASGATTTTTMTANTIVSQSPRAVNYTTSLVERTRGLRNWLRQAKNEDEILSVLSAGANIGLHQQQQQQQQQSVNGSTILPENTIVSQSPRAVNYTTSLVERTRGLRDWLRQAKDEDEMLSVLSASTNIGANIVGGGSNFSQQANL